MHLGTRAGPEAWGGRGERCSLSLESIHLQMHKYSLMIQILKVVLYRHCAGLWEGKLARKDFIVQRARKQSSEVLQRAGPVGVRAGEGATGC